MYGNSIYKKLHQLAVSINLSKPNDNIEESAKRFIEAIINLNINMNIPSTIKGIKDEDIYIMSKHADKEANPLYPVPKLFNRQELEKIYLKVKE